MILNGHINPAKMIEFEIPQVLMAGMRSSLRAATDAPAQNLHGKRFSVIK
jgi:hypothetical protein